MENNRIAIIKVEGQKELYQVFHNNNLLIDLIVKGSDIKDVSVYSLNNKDSFVIDLWEIYMVPVPMTMYSPTGPFRFSFYANYNKSETDNIVDIIFITQKKGNKNVKNHTIDDVIAYLKKALSYMCNHANVHCGIDIPLDEEEHIWLSINKN